MPDNQCTTEQFSVKFILHPLYGQDPRDIHLRGDENLDIANCDIKAKLWWPAFLPRQIAPLFTQKIVHTAQKNGHPRILLKLNSHALTLERKIVW